MRGSISFTYQGFHGVFRVVPFALAMLVAVTAVPPVRADNVDADRNSQGFTPSVKPRGLSK